MQDGFLVPNSRTGPNFINENVYLRMNEKHEFMLEHVIRSFHFYETFVYIDDIQIVLV